MLERGRRDPTPSNHVNCLPTRDLGTTTRWDASAGVSEVVARWLALDGSAKSVEARLSAATPVTIRRTRHRSRVVPVKRRILMTPSCRARQTSRSPRIVRLLGRGCSPSHDRIHLGLVLDLVGSLALTFKVRERSRQLPLLDEISTKSGVLRATEILHASQSCFTNPRLVSKARRPKSATLH